MLKFFATFKRSI